MLLVEIQKQKQLLCLLWFVLENEKKKKMLQKLCGETEELLLVVDDVRVGDFDHLYKSEQMKINI